MQPEKQEEKKQTDSGGWWSRTKQSFRSHMPQWARDNATRVNQLGLMAGTAVITGSVWRGRTISRDIWKAQEDILKGVPNAQILNDEKNPLRAAKDALVSDKLGLSSEALIAKTKELSSTKIDLIKAKAMKLPGLHRQRLFYLPTAVLGLAVGGFIKDKETPEDRVKYKDMSMPRYLGTRLKQSLDPIHHSRQTAGVIGAISGVLAIISAFSQPGGALISEAFVGATLISGFTCLTFINDPAKAKQWLNACWASRILFVITGTYETLGTNPVFPHPLAADLIKTTECQQKMAEAAKTGIKVPRWGLGMGKYALAGRKTLMGDKAAVAAAKGFTSMKLNYLRKDWSYPAGQWFNMGMAAFGILMSGTDETKKPTLPAVANDSEVKKEATSEPASATDTPKHTISKAHATERLHTVPEQKAAIAQG